MTFNEWLQSLLPADLQGALFATGLLLAVLIIVIYTVYLFVLYRKENKPGIVVPVYSPPHNLPPVALSQVMDGRIEMRDIVAEIIDLANKGYIRIENNENSIIFYRELGEGLLSNFETKFLDKLFSGIQGVTLEFVLAPSSNIIPSIQVLLREYLIQTIYPEYFDSPSVKVARIGTITGFFLILGVFFAGPLVLPCVIVGIFLFFVSAFIVRKNPTGQKLKTEILGFIQYLKVAEKDRIEFHNSPEEEHKKFDKLLPYAIALGVEKNWLKKFGKLADSSKYQQIFSPGGVMDQLNR